jgi:two-component system, OmpR family, copper resistance phosphate regulon response regulator CusR
MQDATSAVLTRPVLPQPEPSQVLIAEDDLPLAHFLRRGLQNDKYNVRLTHDGESALNELSTAPYALLILDLNLPKIDGISLLGRLRPVMPHLPVLVLTARNRLEDRITALDSGADDCMVKPFSFQELIARARALLRRNGRNSAGVLQVGDLILSRSEFRVERAGKKIDLTAKEFALLEYLMMNARRTVTRAMIMEEVWKTPYDGSTNLVDVYIKYVRDKIDSGFPSRLMRTARGIGYAISDN